MAADQLGRYAALLREWAPRLDLVAERDLDRLEDRHISDSLRLEPLIGAAPPGPCVDVGSGAGLPGIPLAIADPGRAWRLLEPRRGRAAFLEEAIRHLGLDNCEVVVKTAQEAARDPTLRRSHAVATARALAAPPVALGLIRPLVAPGGVCLVFVGGSAELPMETDLAVAGVVRLVVPADQEGSGA